MPSNNENLNNLIGLILNEEFLDDYINLSNEGLTDPEVNELMNAIYANEKVKKSLVSIDLQNNWLTVPPDVSKCSALQYLLLHNNSLVVPPNIMNCEALQGLGLKGNPLTQLGQKALNALKRKNLIIGWQWQEPQSNELTAESFEQHLQSVYSMYMDLFGEEVVDKDIRNTILKLSIQSLSTLDSIFNISVSDKNEIESFKKFYAASGDKLDTMFNNCHYVIYQDAKIIEDSDLYQAKQLYLKAARLGNDAAIEKIKGYIGTADPEIINIIACPISLDIMINPVTSPSGQTYEASAIKSWITTNNQCLDHMRQPLDLPVGSGRVSLVPNKTLAGLIEYMLYNNGHIYEYEGFINPNNGKVYDSVNLTLDGLTVEPDLSDISLRPDYMLDQLLSYIQKHKKNSRIKLDIY